VLAGLHDCTCCTRCGHRLSSCGSPCDEEITDWGWDYGYFAAEPIRAARDWARRHYARDGVAVPEDGVVRKDGERGCWVEARLWVPADHSPGGQETTSRTDGRDVDSEDADLLSED
jgi:hypothetical protein